MKNHNRRLIDKTEEMYQNIEQQEKKFKNGMGNVRNLEDQFEGSIYKLLTLQKKNIEDGEEGSHQ